MTLEPPDLAASPLLEQALERLRLEGAIFFRFELTEPFAFESTPPALADLLRRVAGEVAGAPAVGTLAGGSPPQPETRSAITAIAAGTARMTRSLPQRPGCCPNLRENDATS
jgi:hypothetical protein